MSRRTENFVLGLAITGLILTLLGHTITTRAWDDAFESAEKNDAVVILNGTESKLEYVDKTWVTSVRYDEENNILYVKEKVSK